MARRGDPERQPFRDMGEARALAERYARDAQVTVRGLASESGRSYGYVHRRVSALTTMRPNGRRRPDDDGDGE